MPQLYFWFWKWSVSHHCNAARLSDEEVRTRPFCQRQSIMASCLESSLWVENMTEQSQITDKWAKLAKTRQKLEKTTQFEHSAGGLSLFFSNPCDMALFLKLHCIVHVEHKNMSAVNKKLVSCWRQACGCLCERAASIWREEAQSLL